jgi:hypothetical protein
MTQQEIQEQPNLLKKLLKLNIKDKPVYVKHKGKTYKIKQLG